MDFSPLRVLRSLPAPVCRRSPSTGLPGLRAAALLAAASGSLASAPAAPVISEIMFHPPSVPENSAEEWLEIHNPPGSGPARLDGWKITRGVQFTFPAGTVIPEDGRLVVAADAATFLNARPGFSGPVTGGWTGRLSNRSERVELQNALGETIDETEYADEGDWARRIRPPVDPYGFQGWEWECKADGAGHTLERRSPLISGRLGQNWAVSPAPGGTPGAAGAADSGAPVISQVTHRPAIPRSIDPIQIHARVTMAGVSGPAERTLYWKRENATVFTAAPMTLDHTWSTGEAVSITDQTYTATIPAQPGNTVLEYYVSFAPGGSGVASTWPAAARTSLPGAVPEVFSQAANALIPVDQTYNPSASWSPGSRPVYRVAMKATERAELRTIQTTSGRQHSDAAMNAAFITEDGGGVTVRQLASIRNRGFSSRLGPPNNFNIGLRSDEPWKDRYSLQLNCRYPHSQVLASNLFALGGVAEQSARPVRLLINGTDQAENGQRMYGTYARIETLNGEWVEKHYPDDSGGNLYRADDHEPNTPGVIPGDLGSGEFRYEGTNPLAYADTFEKSTNEDLNDWSDLIRLCRVVSAPATGGTPEQPAISDADYPQRVREVLNVEQWFTYLALDALAGNQEGGLPTGRADDFALYRGVRDPRFVLVPHDLDTCFNLNNDDSAGTPAERSIFSFHTGNANLPGLQRLFTHPDLVMVYYQKMLSLVENVFTRERLDPLTEELLGGWANPTALNTVRTYISARRANILSQIPRVCSLTTSLPAGTSGLAESADGGVSLSGGFDVTLVRSLRINGQPATLNYRTLGGATAGTWSFSAQPGSGFLAKGRNRLTADFYSGPDGTGELLRSLTLDVLVPDGGTFTPVSGHLAPERPPATLTLQAPATYVPGLPVSVRVDSLTENGLLETGVWNRTVTLTGPAGLILSPSRIELINGRGGALVSIGSSTAGNVQTLVQAGGTLAAPNAGAPFWKFLDSGGEPDPAWRSGLDFDTTAWREGVLEAGAGDDDERTIVNNVNTTQNTRRAYYFRHLFNLTDASAPLSLRIRAVIDDGAVFYLNGTEILRDNVPAGTLGLTASASANRSGSSENQIRTFDITAFAHLLQPGANLLAVQLHNYGSGNNDLGFDCTLEAVRPVPDPGNFTLTATTAGRSASVTLTSLGAAPAPAAPVIQPAGETVWSGLVRVGADTTVPSGATLRLAAGTMVLLEGDSTPGGTGGADLIIQGRLLSEGTAGQPVVLTSSDPSTCWGELLFSSAAQPSTLRHTLLTRGGRAPGRGHTGKGPMIRLSASHLTLEDCTLGHSPAKAVYTTGTGSLTLRRTLITRTITGPELEDGCSLLLEDSHIQEILPTARESDAPAPDDEDCLYIHNSPGHPVIIRRSVLARCGDDVIDGLAGPLTVEDSIIREGWDKGLSLLNNDLVISRTLIVDCDKAIVPKSSTATVRTITADRVTILAEDHNTTLPPWGYSVPPSNPDPDTPGTGFYTQNKSGQSHAGATLSITARNCLILAREPVKVDAPYPASGTVITYSNVRDEDQPATAPWPGTGNISADPLFDNLLLRRLALRQDSPCRDAGDPASAPDPDNSRADMGALPALPANAHEGELRWTRENSPFRLSGEVTVPEGLTLRIDPGVQVQAEAGSRLTVRGRLLAEGTADRRLLFSGVPGATATGDADPIKNGIQTGPPKWGGVRIVDSLGEENVITFADFIDAQGSSPEGAENHGSLGFIRSRGRVESCTWSGTHLRMCYARNSVLTVRECVFPDLFIFDPIEGRLENPGDFAPSAAGRQEQLLAEYPAEDPELSGRADFRNGFPLNGWLRIYGNTFGGTAGLNSGMRVEGGQAGAPGEFIPDCRFNLFAGSTGHAWLETRGDAYAAFNRFGPAVKDRWNSSGGHAAAIRSSGGGRPSTIFAAANVFADSDHALLLAGEAGAVFEHNTVAGVRPDYTFEGIGADGVLFTQSMLNGVINMLSPEDGPDPQPGDGAWLGHNLLSGFPRLFSRADQRVSGGLILTDVTTRIGFGSNLLHGAASTELGPNHPGGVFNPLYATTATGRNVTGNPRLEAGQLPGPGSDAAGTAPGGLDYGATVAPGIHILEAPDRFSAETASRTFTVGGPGITALRWRLDGGVWSDPVEIGSGPAFPRSPGTHAVRQATVSLPAPGPGTHLIEVSGRDMAGNWQDADPAGQGSPVRYEWTGTAGLPQVRLSEVLAAGPDGGEDFIELLNAGAGTSLSGWRLTGAPDTPGHLIPEGTFLDRGALRLFPSSVTGIGLDPDGGEVLLYDASGALVDRVIFGPQAAGYSLTAPPGGGPAWLAGHPTPGTPNTSARTGDPAAVRISEFMAGSRILFEEDWVELVNPSDLPVSLHGLSLSDNAATGQHSIPLPANSYIAPGGFTVFTLGASENRGRGLTFSLDSEQEALALDYGSLRLDTILFGSGTADFSQSRSGTGGGTPVYNAVPTRGFAMASSDPAWQNALQLLRSLRITEIMHFPAGGNDFEFVELANTGSVPLDLAGVAFTEGIGFTFPAMMLPPGARTVVAGRLDSFRQRYGPEVPVAGVYDGRLDNSGETLALTLPPPFLFHILRFRYESGWQTSAQGLGHSLDLAPASAATGSLLIAGLPSPADYSSRSAWQASRVSYGTPGGFTVPPPPDYPGWSGFFALGGGMADDEDRDGLTNLIEFALGSDPLQNTPGHGADRAPAIQVLHDGTVPGFSPSFSFRLPVSVQPGGYGSQGITYLLQESADLLTWQDLARKSPSAPAWNFLTTPAPEVITVPTDSTRLTEVRLTPAPVPGPRRFLRLRILPGS